MKYLSNLFRYKLIKYPAIFIVSILFFFSLFAYLHYFLELYFFVAAYLIIFAFIFIAIRWIIKLLFKTFFRDSFKLLLLNSFLFSSIQITICFATFKVLKLQSIFVDFDSFILFIIVFISLLASFSGSIYFVFTVMSKIFALKKSTNYL